MNNKKSSSNLKLNWSSSGYGLMWMRKIKRGLEPPEPRIKAGLNDSVVFNGKNDFISCRSYFHCRNINFLIMIGPERSILIKVTLQELRAIHSSRSEASTVLWSVSSSLNLTLERRRRRVRRNREKVLNIITLRFSPAPAPFSDPLTFFCYASRPEYSKSHTFNEKSLFALPQECAASWIYACTHRCSYFT